MKQDLNASCPAVAAAIHPAKNMVDTRDTTWFWHDYSVSHWCKSRCVKFSPLYTNHTGGGFDEFCYCSTFESMLKKIRQMTDAIHPSRIQLSQ